MRSEQFGGNNTVALQRMSDREADHTVMAHSSECWEALICVLGGTRQYSGEGQHGG